MDAEKEIEARLNRLGNEKSTIENEEIYTSTPFDEIINFLHKGFITKWQTAVKEIEKKLIDIEGEERLSITKHDKTEAYNLVSKLDEIKRFLNDLDNIKKYVNSKNKSEYNLVIDEKTGCISKLDSSIDDIKTLITSYCSVHDSIGVKNAYAEGMNHAYRIILDIINKEKR